MSEHPKLRHFIDGELCDSADGEWLDNYRPATGKVHSVVASGKAADINRAVAAAKAAFPAWGGAPAEVRAAALNRIADEIERRLPEFAEAESRDQGKTVALATQVDIPRAVANFRFFAQRVLQHEEKSAMQQLPVRAVHYSVRAPMGVAALISPWNLPLYLATWKVAPAIALGNTCVLKPSELTPWTATLLGEACAAAKLPPGVVNIVHGLGPNAGQALIEHRDVRLISFTGGTVTGKRIAATAAPMLKKLSLELGGKNATIVFDDVDVDEVAAATARAAFQNQGEICLCGSRLLVQRGIYDKFLAKLIEVTETLKVGDPTAPDTFMGALVSQQHLEKVMSYVALAKEEGGTIACGGAAPADLPAEYAGGYFLRPTVITGLAPTARCCTEEIFGPVVTVVPFDTEEEALAIANGVEYGLACSVWTRDGARGQRVAHGMEVGLCWINCWMVRDLRMPFGGTKASGVGREGGEYSVDFYTELKTVTTRF